MATLVGALLSRAGHPVCLAGRFEPNLDAIARDGLRVSEASTEWGAPARALRVGAAPLPQADYVLVLVKAHQTRAVAPHACTAAARGRLATLQNGLGNREALVACAGAGRVLVGTTSAGATLVGPGHVRGHVVEAQLGRTDDDSAESLASLFRNAGLPTRVVPDIERVLWAKLAVNCAINPLGALNGVANGVLLERPEWRDAMAAAAREVARVAAGQDIVLEADAAEQAFEVARRTAGNLSSMLQDLQRGSPTEIDAICGAVVEQARRLGLGAPVNDSLWRAVRAREGRPVA